MTAYPSPEGGVWSDKGTSYTSMRTRPIDRGETDVEIGTACVSSSQSEQWRRSLVRYAECFKAAGRKNAYSTASSKGHWTRSGQL